MICILVRGLIVALAYYFYNSKSSILHAGITLFLIFVGISFMLQYLTDYRKYGAFGQHIWWKNYRPVHSILYLSAGWLFYNRNNNSYKPLLIDLLFGIVVFVLKRVL